MDRWAKLNITLLVALIVLVALNVIVDVDYTKRNREFLPEMVRSVPYDSYTENPVFADGKTLQQPPEGTIPRSGGAEAYGPGEREALRAGRELTNPADTTRDALRRGEQLYGIYCTPCHGAGGAGDGMVSLRGFPPPPALYSDSTLALPDGRVYHIITHGRNNMPGYETQIETQDRWRIVRYLEQLQAEALAEAAADTASSARDTTRAESAAAASAPAANETVAATAGGTQ